MGFRDVDGLLFLEVADDQLADVGLDLPDAGTLPVHIKIPGSGGAIIAHDQGEAVAVAIEEEAAKGPFLSRDDFRERTKVSKTIIDLLDDLIKRLFLLRFHSSLCTGWSIHARCFFKHYGPFESFLELVILQLELPFKIYHGRCFRRDKAQQIVQENKFLVQILVKHSNDL